MPDIAPQEELRCGEVFCERCGDCLVCYGGENCWDGGVDNGSHIWPVSVPGQNDTGGRP